MQARRDLAFLRSCVPSLLPLHPPMRPVRVLFVCLGNICRSPLAHALFEARVAEAGLGGRIEADSAGTAGWHAGAPPDRRMTDAAARRGLDIGALRARHLERADLDRFDHVFAMDRSTLHDTLCLDPDGDHGTRVRLFREFDPEPDGYEVPDPYAGAPEGFEHVYDIADRTTRAILARLRAAHGL